MKFGRLHDRVVITRAEVKRWRHHNTRQSVQTMQVARRNLLGRAASTPGFGVTDDALDHRPASPQTAFEFVHPFVHIVNR